MAYDNPVLTGPLTAYGCAMKKRILSAEEEVRLSTLVRDGLGERRDAVDWSFDDLTPGSPARAAAEELVERNLRLVHHVARSYPSLGRYDDMVQDGTIGLMRAVLKFDPALGNKFSTYATWWIRQAVVRGMTNSYRLVRLPAHVEEKVGRLRAWLEREQLAVEDAVCLYPDGVEEIDVSAEVMMSVWRWSVFYSLDDVGILDVSEELVPDHAFEVDAALGAAAGTDPRATHILTRRFGLDEEEPETLMEIGQRLGITRERVRQLEKKALVAAREHLDRIA